MDPLSALIVSLIGVGTQLIGGFLSGRAAEERERRALGLMDRQIQAAQDALNLLLQVNARQPLEGPLAEAYSAIQGKAARELRAQAAQGGLTGTGLEVLAQQDLRGAVASNLLRDLALGQSERLKAIVQGYANLGGALGDAARTNFALSQEYLKGVNADLSWLPFLASRVDWSQLNIDWSKLFGGLGGAGQPAPTAPSRPPGDYPPSRVV